MIFVSTGGVATQPAAATAAEWYALGIAAVELSGGAHSPTQHADLLPLRQTTTFQVHNYFPPPAEPFVFNLAAADRAARQRSMDHAREAMRLAVALGRPIYSFHAGFRLTPEVSELGSTIGRRALRERSAALTQFGEAMLTLAEEARQEGVTLLIENNVLAQRTFDGFGDDPLLLTHPDEMATFLAAMPANVGLLLDVGHLKVSGQTLRFDPVAAHARVQPWIRGYHLSDNDGVTDSNDPVTEGSWFWDVIDAGLDYYGLEVYRLPAPELVAQRDLVEKTLSSRRNVRGGARV